MARTGKPKRNWPFVTVGLCISALVGGAYVLTAQPTLLPRLTQSLRPSAASELDIATRTEARIATLTEQLRTDMTALHMPPNPLTTIIAGGSVDEALTQQRAAQNIYATYAQRLDRELAAARADLNRLDAASRAIALDDFEEAYGPQTVLARSVALQSQVLRSGEHMLVLLQENKAHWMIQGGNVMFDDQALLDRFDDATAEYDGLARQVIALQRSAEAAQTGQEEQPASAK